MALLHLLHDWTETSGRGLVVFTVDHALRSEAAEEAEFVKSVCQRLGHDHETLVWETPRKSQQAARRARHRLLAEACQRWNSAVLFMAHTLDDVVETVLIRRRRGVRDASAVGPTMAAVSPVWPEGRGLTVLRPLVHTRRDILRNYLSAKAQTWTEDPSNQDPAFERPRIRNFLRRHPRLHQLAIENVRQLQRARSTADNDLATILSDPARVSVDASGLITLDIKALTPALLRILVQCAGGASQAPRGDAVTALLDSLHKPGERQTLGGAWLQRTKTGFLIGRDPIERPALADASGLWDNRYICVDAPLLEKRSDLPFLVREMAPPDAYWREVISDRIAHIARCLQTPSLCPVQDDL